VRPFLFRSIYNGQIIYVQSGRLLAETDTHVVMAALPGDGSAVPLGGRLEVLDDIVARRVRLGVQPWHTNRVLWLIPHREAHALGLFWDGATGAFKGHYVNLQTPAQRTALGIDACDQVLDVVIPPNGAWRWKDEDELEYAVRIAMFSEGEAAEIRAEGARVIAQLPVLLPTGWEDWRPDPTWAPVPLPDGWDVVRVSS
jgi:Protein of unknown function (DUF402)